MNKSKKIVSIIFFAVAAVMIIASVAGFIKRGTDSTEVTLGEMRYNSVIHAASDGVVASVAQKASAQKLAELRKQPDFRSLGSDAINAALAEAEAAARADAEGLYSDVNVPDALQSKIEDAIIQMEAAMGDFAAVELAERELYADIMTTLYNDVDSFAALTADKSDDEIAAELVSIAEDLASAPQLTPGFVEWAKKLAADEIAKEEAAAAEADVSTAEGEGAEDTSASAFTVDYFYFVPSEELDLLKAPGEAAFATLWTYLVEVIPELDNLKGNTLEAIQNNLYTIVTSTSLGFAERYGIYADEKADEYLSGGTAFMMKLAAGAKSFLVGGIAALILALVLMFWSVIVGKLGVPRTIIGMFFIFLCLASVLYDISVPLMLGNVLERVGMYGILALAMLPGIQCGIGLNMGMTLGCISGLLATVISLQYNMTGGVALIFSCVAGILIAIPLGWAYSLLLNKMKGDEMTISTYVGFSFVSLMCIGWMLLPFSNPKIIWLLCGRGLRVTHSLLGSFGHLLDNFLSFSVFGITVPTGLLLVFAAACLLVWLFSRSKAGIAMTAVGSNPRFAEASGLSVDKYRTLGTVISTCIAALGIVIYSQAFGYAQLYTAPRQLGFIAASAILIGGATTSKAKVSHVVIGVFLFEGVLALGQQMANAVVAGGGLSEVMRIMISNGIILYALTQSGGAKNE